jgi:hypothetical protein
LSSDPNTPRYVVNFSCTRHFSWSFDCVHLSSV